MARSSSIQRRLDFWFGVPLLAVIGAVRRLKPLPTNPKRIGVFSPTAIGDLILQSGVLAHIHETYPLASIVLFHGKSNASAVPLLETPLKAEVCDFANIGSTLRAVRSADLDIVVDLTPWPRLTAIYAALSGAMTIGFKSVAQMRHFAFDIAVPHLRTRHESENLRAVADIFSFCRSYRIAVRRDLVPSPKELPYDRLVLFHISPGGSRAADKSWPIDRWSRLVRLLVADGFSVGFTGIDADSNIVESVLREAGVAADAAFSLCGCLSLTELGAALKSARLLITVDTGILHLASALDAPLLALHGPTHSGRWGALSAAATSLDVSHPEAGYIHLGFEEAVHGDVLMDLHLVEKVYAQAKAIIGGRRVDRSAGNNERQVSIARRQSE